MSSKLVGILRDPNNNVLPISMYVTVEESSVIAPVPPPVTASVPAILLLHVDVTCIKVGY